VIADSTTGGAPVTAPKKRKMRAPQSRVRQFLRRLGPGLITGASDDDPSGIGTYSQAGAQLGYGIGWTMLLTFPLMVAIQEISARIGRTTGQGIAGILCRHYPGWLLYPIVALLFLANTINIGADLGAMADAVKLLIGGKTTIYVVVFGLLCVLGTVFMDYDRYVLVLKWMTLSLFAYLAALLAAGVDWSAALLAPRAYDVAFTSLLLSEPPLRVSDRQRPLVRALGRLLARSFIRRYQRQAATTVEPGELRWNQAVICLRALTEVAGWVHDGVVDTRAGHPWLVSGPAFAQRLTTLTGAPVRAR